MSGSGTERLATDIVFTPAVKVEQERLGSRAMMERMEQTRGFGTVISPDLAAYLGARDSIYLATASADGRPTIQHRGGPKGFIRVVDPRRLAFAEYRGNRQYVSFGNLSENDRVALFAMDYGERQRIKIWGRARVIERAPEGGESLDAEIWAALSPEAERAMVITVEAWDVNCPQHITPRYDEKTIADATAKLIGRIAEQAREIDRLRAMLAQAGLDADEGFGTPESPDAETSA